MGSSGFESRSQPLFINQKLLFSTYIYYALHQQLYFMKRSEFIKNLLLLFGATALPSGLQAMVHQYRRIYLLQNFVRGFAYYEGPKLLHIMKVGALLDLVREPNNEYDEFAIAIHYQGNKIGFVPAETNEILAKILDANLLKLQAEITFIKTKVQAWENTAIAIYVLQPDTEPLPPSANYLLAIDEPYYRSVRSKNYFVQYDEALFEEEESDAEGDHRLGEKIYEILETKSKDDGIYGDIHNNFSADELAIIAKQNRIIINKNKLPKHISANEIALQLDAQISNLDNFFSEDGYIMVNMDKLNNLPITVQNIAAVLDKSTQQFMEIVLG
jgi:HIRAN domain